MKKRFSSLIWRRLFAQNTSRGLLNAFLILMAFVFIFQCVSIIYTYNFISSQFLRYQDEILEQAGLKLNGIIEKLSIAEKQVINLINSYALFQQEEPLLSLGADARDFEYDLRNIRRSNNDIREIFVIMPETIHILSSSVEHFDRDILLAQPILQTATITDQYSHVSAVHGADYIGFENDDVYSVSFVRMIRNVENYPEPAAIIQIDLKYDSILEILNDITLDSHQQIFLIDNEDRVVADLDSQYLGITAKETNNPWLTEAEQSPGIHILNNTIISTYQLEAVDWRIVAYIDYMSLLGRVLSSMSLTLLLLGAMMLIMLFFTTYFTKKFSKPLEELVEHMSQIESETFLPIQLSEDNADMRILGKSYNAMLERIRQLLLTNAKKENERARAEYMAHMMQINPHFLYNTLDNMRAIALRDGSPNVADIAKSMAELFKYSIESRKEDTSLEQEIIHVQNYIAIQRHRFGGTLDLFIDIKAELMHKRVLKFVLQPMVENATEHGWKRRSDRNLIVVIQARKNNDDLWISVHDNGAGIMPNRLKAIQERLEGESDGYEGDTRFGIGLINVQSRIRYRYGKHYGIQIEATPQTGTKVILHFPCEEYMQEAENVQDYHSG